MPFWHGLQGPWRATSSASASAAGMAAAKAAERATATIEKNFIFDVEGIGCLSS